MPGIKILVHHLILHTSNRFMIVMKSYINKLTAIRVKVSTIVQEFLNMFQQRTTELRFFNDTDWPLAAVPTLFLGLLTNDTINLSQTKSSYKVAFVMKY